MEDRLMMNTGRVAGDVRRLTDTERRQAPVASHIDWQEMKLANALSDCLDEMDSGQYWAQALSGKEDVGQEIAPLLDIVRLLRRRSALALASA
jgi:hypothetical protein